jgi:uncharacterized membrane protein YdbT with pleckstrin-like domain
MNPDENQKEPKQSPIMPEAEQKRRPVFDPTGRVEQITSDETKIADVRRHPFGLFLIYLQAFVGLGLGLGLIFAFLPSVLEVTSISDNTADSIAFFFALIVIGLGLVFLLLATKIYQGNQLIVTDINITQVLQVGLFSRKVSELSMKNVEDVTAQQSGIFPTLFNYGTLRIETAGEQNNFVFIYCPNPNAYAKAILDARQAFIA